MSRTSVTTCFYTLRRMSSCAFLVGLVSLAIVCSQALAQQVRMRPVPTQEQKVEQWRSELNQKGLGEKSRWEARLHDGRKIKGYLTEIREDGFTLVNTKTDEKYQIAFSELESLRRQGPRWPVIAGIGGAVFGGLVVAGLVAASRE